MRTASALRMTCSDFRDDAGVAVGGLGSGFQRLHGRALRGAVKRRCEQKRMAAALMALLTPRLLVRAMVLGTMPPLHGAAQRGAGDLW